MKTLIVLLILVATAITGYADEFRIPFGCYPQELQNKFEEYGYRLELDATYRAADSWGFLENRGNEYRIFTYNSLSAQELQDLMEIINENNC